MANPMRIATFALLVSWLPACSGTLGSDPGVDGSTDALDGSARQKELAQCQASLPGESQRLTPSQLNGVMTEVFGTTVSTHTAFPAPDASAGFSTGNGATRIAKGDIRQIADAADAVALGLLDSLPSLAGCASGVTTSCALSYIRETAPRLYRGLHTATDVASLEDLYGTLSSGDQPMDPSVALAGVVSAMLQSPAFLYLLEIGEATDRADERRLTGREIANRMALLLTNAPADQELVAAADAGDLDTPDGRRAQATRLLEKDGSAMVQFFAEWLEVNHVELEERVSKDVAHAFEGEFKHLVQQAVRENRSLAELFSRTTTFANATLADYYGLDEAPAGNDFEEVAVPQNRQGGLLTTGLVAAAHSSLGGTSIIQRGHFVREGLLCDELGSPPEGATSQNPVLPENSTVRDQIDARKEVGGCTGCHSLMDGIGIGMEDLDDVGQFRETYELTGHDVDVEGEVTQLLVDPIDGSTEDVTFQGTAELAQTLSTSPALAHCAQKKFFTYAMGREEQADCHAQTLSEAGVDASPESLVLNLVASERFVLRSDDTTEHED